jgi:hypothetical protein
MHLYVRCIVFGLETHEENMGCFLFICGVSEDAERLNFIVKLVTLYIYIISKNLIIYSVVPYINIKLNIFPL